MDNKSRRDFLKETGALALGLSCGAPLVASSCTSSIRGDALAERKWAMVIDMEKATDGAVRRACREACEEAHNVPKIPEPTEEIRWIWDEKYHDVFEDQIHDYTPQEVLDAPVLVLCNHCTNPPCVRVCPTQATWKRQSDGLVMMDMHRCIGCRYCMAACPYAARSFNWRDPRPFIPTDSDGNFPSEFPTRTRGVVEKCNFCADRLRDGLAPACVEAANQVPGKEGALVFGDLMDPDSEVSRILREKRTISRRVSLGTGPKVFYIV